MEKATEEKLQDIYPLFEQFDILEAKDALSKALEEDLSNSEILFCLKACGFWINHKGDLSNCANIFEQGEQILSDWKEFVNFLQEESSSHEKCIFSIKKGVFTFALQIFMGIYAQMNDINLQKNLPIEIQKNKVLSDIAVCNKSLGNYEIALNILKEAEGTEKGESDSSVLAEMADCYALCGDEKMAKLLFREAFYIDASSVDIRFLESQIFCQVYEEVKKRHSNKDSYLEWVPVEGVLLGIFDVKRELRTLEVGKLKQDIFALENELKSEGSQPEILIPRLINKYFWLIDHYLATKDENSKINDNLLKIKWLDSDIYQRYTV